MKGRAMMTLYELFDIIVFILGLLGLIAIYVCYKYGVEPYMQDDEWDDFKGGMM